jgi:hypothetical protein
MTRERFANNVTTTLSADISSGVTSLVLTSATGFPAAEFRILIDSELILVGARSGTTCSSRTRGSESTTAAAHTAGATITVVLTAASLDGLVPLTTRGDVMRAGVDGDPERVALGTVGQRLSSDGSDVVWSDVLSDIVYVIDGGGVAITTGVKGDISPGYSGVITAWRVLGDQSGSIVIDIWKDTYANYPPTVADTIAGSEKPTLSSVAKNEDTSLNSGSGWAFSSGDCFRFNVDSITTCTRVALILRTRRTS